MLRFILPAVLILLAAGLFAAPSIPLDRPKVSDWPGQTYATDRALSGWDDPRLQRRPEESALAFAARANRAVHAATYHCDVIEHDQTVASYVVNRLGLLDKKDLVQGLLDPTLMRCGFCHQRAFVLARALDRAGVEDAHVLGIVGHVVTAFEADGVEYVVDPDFGVDPFELESPGLMERVEAGYAGKVSTTVAFETIKAGYADPSDDGRYHGGLERLEGIAERQAEAAGKVVTGFRILAVGLVWLALMTAAFGWVRYSRKAK